MTELEFIATLDTLAEEIIANNVEVKNLGRKVEILKHTPNNLRVRFADGREINTVLYSNTFCFFQSIYKIDSEEIMTKYKEAKEAFEAEKKAIAAAKAATEASNTPESAPVVAKHHTSKASAKSLITCREATDFEMFLIKSGYKPETDNGDPSTVYAYIKAVDGVLKEEGHTWASLEKSIDNIIPMYDIGGAKEYIGFKSNSTVINALRRFKEFVEKKRAENHIDMTKVEEAIERMLMTHPWEYTGYDVIRPVEEYAKANVKEALFVMPDAYRIAQVKGDYRLGQYKKKAFELYKACADDGDAFSQYRVGYMYETGFGVKKDIAAAIRYYEMGHNQGNAESTCALASLIELGKGIEKDNDKAMSLYKEVFGQEKLKSYADKKGEIQLRVYELHVLRKAAWSTSNESMHWLKKAALAGSGRAQVDIAFHDVNKMRKLAEQNNPDALYLMSGLQLEFSDYLLEEEALEWFEKYKALGLSKDPERDEAIIADNFHRWE